MFCPLCHAEYREGFTVCATCRAALVATDAPESERTPPRLKWVTHDQRESDAVFGRLFEAGIPCLEEAQTDFFSVSIARRRPTITLYILERDAAAARQATGVEFVPDVPTILIPEGAPVQDCPFCSAKFPAGQNFCPACGGDVLEWKPGAEPESAPPSGSDASGLAPSSATADDGEAQLVWRGGDPVTFSLALEALCENQISHHAGQTTQHLAFGEGMPRPKLEIRVRASDAVRARELLLPFQDPFPLVPQEPLLPEPAAGTDPTLGTSSSPAAFESSAEGARFFMRRSRLRWGLGLGILSVVLLIWLQRTGPLWFASHSDFFSPAQGQVRLIAVLVLFGAGFIANLAALLLLFLAWGGRLDKLGLLSLFFGLKGVLFLGTYILFMRL